jgi:tetratricopeptide (TPR) repeat protein
MFDPLHKWLGIPPDEQPPHHYRLLGIATFEQDTDVIDAAADKQLAFLHDLANGQYAVQAEQLANQISAARICLRSRDRRKAYDEMLRGQLGRTAPPAAATASPAHQAAGPHDEVSTPIHIRPDEQTVRGKPRSAARRRTASSAPRYWHLLSLLGVVALAAIGYGIATGRLAIKPSILEAIGINSGPPEQSTAAQPAAPAPQAATTPLGVDTPAQSPPVSTQVEKPAPDAGRAAMPDVVPPPAVPERSLGDLLHQPPAAADSAAVVKSPLPSESELEPKLELIRELYQNEYRQATSSAQKVELAKLMHREGQETSDDPVGRFALWQVSRDILTREGEYESALAIVDNLAIHYQDFDALASKVSTLQDSASKVSDAPLAGFLAAVRKVAQDCLQAEQFEQAQSLCEFASQTIGSRASAAERDELARLQAETKLIEEAFHRYRQALQTLRSGQRDSEANQVVGQYLCFLRGDWERGLDHLVLAGDQAIREAAERELGGPTDTSQAIAIADAWFEIAQSLGGDSGRVNVQQHSLDWYREALQDAKGLDRKKVDARIAELERKLPAAGADGGDRATANNVLGYRVRTSAESRSDFAKFSDQRASIGMGPRPDGRGEAQAGIELQGVTRITVAGAASHDEMPEIDQLSKTGFVVDYHTPGGYAKRVFLGLGLRPGRQFTEAPPWGTARPPDVTTDIGRALSYEIDLTRWAPSTWDGRCWFTIYMQNAGPNRSLGATVSW